MGYRPAIELEGNMRSIIFAAFLAALASRAHAAEIMDGSGAGFDRDIADKIVGALATQTNDPYSAQIIKLHRAQSGTLCAFVNLKNLTGGYTGFQPVFLLPGNDTALLDDKIECNTGNDPLTRRERTAICDINLNRYIDSAGAEQESETRACLSEFQGHLFYFRAVNRIAKANLPLAKEFK